ncbi:Calx-beta domain-containing protein [Pseudoalteromonas aurantia]|uniref:Hemolysin n=1 Tax=Pseudoalteromonas aurantia TaxID=43654 RepID=A0A5S3UXF7_9GAMM|nr:Calx-beta domain-containing protein [Pseudoalteromonas aurantia]TMO62092.1 hemolysin [Pseudoalteromonas aurantia]TMO69044.1 hemolysin [Pseudoalteromonas aurantia]
MFTIKKIINSMVLTGCLFTANIQANNCTGQLFSINAGRGEVGLVVAVNEYSGDAFVHSKAKFSSAAMAYASDLNRLYYISAPRASEYKLDVSGVDLNSTELKSLPISAQKQKYTKIAYVDMSTKEHVTLANSKPMYRLAYDSTSQLLYGSYFNKLYSIEPSTGATTLLGSLSGYSSNPEMWRGDLAFKNGQLYLISNAAIFTVNIATLTVAKLAEHNLPTVTGAVFNGVGELIISRDKSNDYGSHNMSELYHVIPTTGAACRMATIPTQINDLAVDNSNGYACPEVPLCQLVTKPTVSLTPVTASANEGSPLSFNIELSSSHSADVTVDVSTTPGTATSSDYSYTDQTVTIPAGSTSYTISIPTVDNAVFQGNKQFTVHINASNNVAGSDSETATIIENDTDPAVQLQNAAKNGSVNWEGSDGCCDGQRIRGIKGHFPNAPAGTVVNFYISSQKIATKSLPANSFSYAGNSQSTWWMNNGTTAWATLTYNGVTVNVHTGHRAQIHNHHNVNCANGCW